MTGIHDDIDPNDELMSRLADARPSTPQELTSPTSDMALALRQEILMTDIEPDINATPIRNLRRRRYAQAVGAAGVAAALVAIAFVVRPGGSDSDKSAASGISAPTRSSTTPKSVEVSGLRLIAERSGTALGHSGRAVVRFATDIENTQRGASSGTTDLAFSGDDLEMTVTFDSAGTDRPGFTAENKTVGGEFYLLDGPEGAKKWYHDTNAAGGRGGEMFSVDPRTVLSLFSGDAAFREVGTETISGVSTRHLRSTRPVPASSLNFGLGPVGESDVTADLVDIWVGNDDVTRRVDLKLSNQMKEVDPAVAPTIEKRTDGSLRVTEPDGKVTVIAPGEPLPDTLMVTRTVRSTYSVTFSDIGSSIEIVAPANATDVAGQG